MRKLTALVTATVLALALVGCTSSNSDEEGVSTEASQDAGSGGNDSSSGGDSSSGADSSSGDASSPGDATTDSSDLSDILGEDAGDCLEVSLTYASIYLSALGLASDADRQELQDQVDQIKGQVPEDIQDDMQTIADGIANADGLVEVGEFFDSEEYQQADENITRYLEETCPTGGN